MISRCFSLREHRRTRDLTPVPAVVLALGEVYLAYVAATQLVSELQDLPGSGGGLADFIT